MMEFVTVEIKKPLYEYEGSPFVNIRDIYLKKAKAKHLMLKITTPTTTHYTTPEKWKKGGKRTKEVFLFENSPMILYGNYATNNEEPKEPEKITMDLSVRERLSQIWKEKGYAKA